MGFSNTHLDYSRLFGMQAQTLVQSLALIVVTAVATHFIARSYALGSTIVACRYNSVILIYNYCAHRCLHTIWSSPRYISHFHKILIPSGSKKADHFFFLATNLFNETFSRTFVNNSHPNILQTFIKLLISCLFVNSHKLFHSLKVIRPSFLFEKVLISLLERDVNIQNI